MFHITYRSVNSELPMSFYLTPVDSMPAFAESSFPFLVLCDKVKALVSVSLSDKYWYTDIISFLSLWSWDLCFIPERSTFANMDLVLLMDMQVLSAFSIIFFNVLSLCSSPSRNSISLDVMFCSTLSSVYMLVEHKWSLTKVWQAVLSSRSFVVSVGWVWCQPTFFADTLVIFSLRRFVISYYASILCVFE